MAKFLDTTGVSYHLQQLINQAQDTLILISPYLKLNDRLRQSLEDKDRLKIDIRLIYGKNELQPEQINWLRTLHSVRTSFCENLHAKCYLNEGEAILTSMNLYEFSQVNNHEMGVYVTKAEEPELYGDILNEARRLIRISDEIRVTVEKVQVTEAPAKPEASNAGHCIRCGKSIALNPAAPYCPDCYRVWKRYENPDHKEARCHICGTAQATTLNKPVCYACFKSNRRLFNSDGATSRVKASRQVDKA
ncbi:MAG TPA: phospholipase D family protein [Anaerolineales bacterium]|nr:phospholipase D family protein [Anaerolineales bacterium]